MAVAQLVLDFVKVLVWPMLVVGLILGFRQQLGALIVRLRKARFAGGEAEFTDAVNDAEIQLRAARSSLSNNVQIDFSTSKPIEVESIAAIKVDGQGEGHLADSTIIDGRDLGESEQSATRQYVISKSNSLPRVSLPYSVPRGGVDFEVELSRLRHPSRSGVLADVRGQSTGHARIDVPRFDDVITNLAMRSPELSVAESWNRLNKYLKRISVRFSTAWKEADSGGARYFRLTRGKEPERFLLGAAIDLESRALLDMYTTVTRLRTARREVAHYEADVSYKYASQYVRICQDVARIMSLIL